MHGRVVGSFPGFCLINTSSMSPPSVVTTKNVQAFQLPPVENHWFGTVVATGS